MVKAMCAYGIGQEAIATVLGICAETLRLRYRRQLDTGAVEATPRSRRSLFKAAIKGNVTAQIFWCKTRMGWKETIRIGGEEGGAPLVLQVIFGVERG